MLLPRSIFPKSMEASSPAAEPKQQNVDSEINSAKDGFGFMEVVGHGVAVIGVALFL